MPPRLSDLYKRGDQVEICFEAQGDTRWRPAQVLGAQPPGLWVQTPDGRHWFVTNGRRIKHTDASGEDDSC
ncbi:MAG: hypothetical protein KDI55_06140 [Anaerolineae bacterium]|nr:hypothetical protein [Anaerolineae bacterium]MCB0253291.1 hypothetical protein [Anaerolineae bacterium]